MIRPAIPASADSAPSHGAAHREKAMNRSGLVRKSNVWRASISAALERGESAGNGRIATEEEKARRLQARRAFVLGRGQPTLRWMTTLRSSLLIIGPRVSKRRTKTR